MDNKVIYTSCEDYSPDNINKSVDFIFNNLTEIDSKIKSANKILIKPNLLAPREPEEAVTTHPEVLISIINRVKEINPNAKITIADTPAGKLNENIMKKLYSTCKIDYVAQITGSELNWDFSDVNTYVENGVMAKNYPLITVAEEADLIINVAKMKTHCFTMLTCATKNYFGIIPGLLKMQFHFTIPRLDMFSGMLLDIEQHLSAKTVNIVDGIVGMEGNGPSNGIPINSKCMIASYNSVYADVVACKVMEINPDKITTIKEALRRGIIQNINDVNLVTDSEIKTFKFKTPPERGRALPSFVPEWLSSGINNLFIPKPVIISDKCVGCKICAKGCPASVITVENNKARIKNYSKCIRCYCCQEVCPKDAIELVKPLGRRLLKKLKVR